MSTWLMDAVTAVQLDDGWHEVDADPDADEGGTFYIDTLPTLGCLFDEQEVRLDGDWFAFTVGGHTIAGPLSSVRAIRYDGRLADRMQNCTPRPWIESEERRERREAARIADRPE